mmetsp:Transcript_21489/g.54667  ORF Transcript_21489/g.54667 Transcript_21489/m.54667 type:complete len:209 (-) Transcript_21489:283-909(-)
MASPTWPLAYMRLGRPSGPAGVTVPPAARMRFFSSGRSGLWSLVRSRATTLPPWLAPLTARLSPEHAHQHSLPRRYTTVEVVPQLRALGPSSEAKSSWSVRTMLVRRAFLGSRCSRSWSSSSSSGTVVVQYSLTFSPLRPWPSKMHRRAWLKLLLYGQHTTPRSWLIFAADWPRGPGLRPCFVCTPIRDLSKGALPLLLRREGERPDD